MVVVFLNIECKDLYRYTKIAVSFGVAQPNLVISYFRFGLPTLLTRSGNMFGIAFAIDF